MPRRWYGLVKETLSTRFRTRIKEESAASSYISDDAKEYLDKNRIKAYDKYL
ncbi:MAG: hypothetical protein R2766_00045 [Saprospiraceae bacterium]